MAFKRRTVSSTSHLRKKIKEDSELDKTEPKEIAIEPMTSIARKNTRGIIVSTASLKADEKAKPFIPHSSVTGVIATESLLATSTLETETTLELDATSQLEKAAAFNEKLKEKGINSDGLYHGSNYYRKYSSSTPSSSTSNGRKEKDRASSAIRLSSLSHVKANVRFDYAIDLCKDWKEFGYCGFGDNCKFLHDRSDYKTGWELEEEYQKRIEQEKAQQQAALEAGEDNCETIENPYYIPDEAEEACSSSIPLECPFCNASYKAPIVKMNSTSCKHFYCQSCVMTHQATAAKKDNLMSRTTKFTCPVCSVVGDATFKVVTKEAEALLKEKRKKVEAEAEKKLKKEEMLLKRNL